MKFTPTSADPFYAICARALQGALAKRGWSTADFAERLGVSRMTVVRLLDPTHPTKLPAHVRALDAAGVKVSLDMTSDDPVMRKRIAKWRRP